MTARARAGCPPEPTLLVYVEAELTGEARRACEAHLIGCRDCRARVVALRDESRLLADVLLEREREAHVHARAPAPEPGVALGLPVAIAAVTSATAALGFLVESPLPGGLDFLNPLRLKGAYEMVFDVIFMLHDRAPGALELFASVGAVAGVSAVLTFAVGVVYRRVFGAALVLLALLLADPRPASALVVRFDEDTHVSATEVVPESMLLSGDVIHVDGVVDGDLVVFAHRVAIGGTVKGNVYALARNLEITGTVEGSVHGGIERLLIDGDVKGSAYAASEIATLAPDGGVGRDLLLFVEEGIVGGPVGRDLVFAGDRLEIRSAVGRNVDVRLAERVSLRDGARIAGSLDATLPGESDLVRAPGAQVGGEVTIQPRRGVKEHYLDRYREPGFYLLHALGLVAAFLFGLMMRWLHPAIFEAELHTGGEFLRSLGVGFLAIVATPFAILAAALTVVGIPIAVMALFAYLVALYTGEITVGAWLGRVLLPPADAGLLAFGRSLFAGLALITVIGHLPFLGPAVLIVSTLLGVGLLVDRARGVAPARGY
jgi:cytoskeletal protein CcmA (bactofilin family)